MSRRALTVAVFLVTAVTSRPLHAQQADSARLARFKLELAREIDGRARFTQQDPSRYRSYLDQLVVQYPTVRRPDGSCPAPGPRP